MYSFHFNKYRKGLLICIEVDTKFTNTFMQRIILMKVVSLDDAKITQKIIRLNFKVRRIDWQFSIGSARSKLNNSYATVNTSNIKFQTI